LVARKHPVKNLTPSETAGSLLINRTIFFCLFFLIAVIPLLINPLALDYWYKRKIDAVYALLIIAGGALAGRRWLLKRPLSFKDNPLVIPLIAYGVSGTLSTLFSIDPAMSVYGDYFREEGLFTVLAYLALTVLFATAIESSKQLQDFIKGLLFACAMISLYAVIQYFGYNPTEHFIPLMRTHGGGVGSTIGNPNFLGKFLVLILPLYIVSYLDSERLLLKCIYLAGALLGSAALILTFTRASWLGFLAGFLVLFLLIEKKGLLNKKKEILVGFSVVIAVVLVFTVQSSIRTSQTKGKTTYSIKDKIIGAFDLEKGSGVATRLFVWNKALILIRQRPLVGFGLDTHIKVMRRFNLEYIEKFNNYVIIDRVHNNYLDTAIAQGLIGLGAYLSIIITFLVWLGKTIRWEKDPSRKIIYCGFFSAWCGYLVNDLFIFSVVSVSPTFWSLMGITISLKRLSKPSLRPGEVSDHMDLKKVRQPLQVNT
jgi:putative inorganic carbon (HCO3(-)) transporter